MILDRFLRRGAKTANEAKKATYTLGGLSDGGQGGGSNPQTFGGIPLAGNPKGGDPKKDPFTFGGIPLAGNPKGADPKKDPFTFGGIPLSPSPGSGDPKKEPAKPASLASIALSPSDFGDIGNPRTYYGADGKPHEATVIIINSGPYSGKFGVMPNDSNTVLFAGDSREAADSWISARANPPATSLRPIGPAVHTGMPTASLPHTGSNDRPGPAATAATADSHHHTPEHTPHHSVATTAPVATTPESHLATAAQTPTQAIGPPEFKVAKNGDILEKSANGGNWYEAESAKKAVATNFVSEHGLGMGTAIHPASTPVSSASVPPFYTDTTSSAQATHLQQSDPTKLSTQETTTTDAHDRGAPTFQAKSPVANIQTLHNGATLTTLDNGKEIEQMPGHTPYVVKAADPAPATTQAVPAPTTTPAPNPTQNGIPTSLLNHLPSDDRASILDPGNSASSPATSPTPIPAPGTGSSPPATTPPASQPTPTPPEGQALAPPTVPIAQETPAPSPPVTFTDTTSSRQASGYTGGAEPVKVEHLNNGATLTTTATGAEIEQMPGHSAYQVKAPVIIGPHALDDSSSASAAAAAAPPRQIHYGGRMLEE